MIAIVVDQNVPAAVFPTAPQLIRVVGAARELKLHEVSVEFQEHTFDVMTEPREITAEHHAGRNLANQHRRQLRGAELSGVDANEMRARVEVVVVLWRI